MELDLRDLIKAHNAALRSRGDLPPKSAIGALFTLMPSPSDILMTYEESGGGEVEWQILARDDAGLVVVKASAAESWFGSTYEDPESSELRATWHPIAQLQAIHIVAVQRWNQSSDDGTINGRETWALTIAGEELVLDPRHIGVDAKPDAAAFCRALIAARADSR